ncbi:MAG: hypothetical protein WDN25_13280 [Acetobacteraceae bacterium]
MTPITIIHEIKLSGDTLIALREIVLDAVREFAAAVGAAGGEAPLLPVPSPQAPPAGSPGAVAAAPQRAATASYPEAQAPAAVGPTPVATGAILRTRDDWVTEPRIAMLADMRRQGQYAVSIADALNKLPGPRVDRADVRRYAARHGIVAPMSEPQQRHLAAMREKLRQKQAQTVAPTPAAAASTVPAPASPEAGADGGADRAEVRRPAAPAPKPHWCTEARRAVLRRLFDSPATPGQIKTALGAEPGPNLPNWDGIATYANVVLKLRRGQVAPVAPSALAGAMQPPPAEPPDTTTPIVTDTTTIRAWAAQRGVTFNGAADLAAVNATAHRIGHRPFAIETPALRRGA